MIHSRLSLHIFWTRHLDHLQKLNPINKNHVIMYSVGDNMTTKNIYLNVSVSSTISFNVRFTVCQLLLNSCRNQTNVQQPLRISDTLNPNKQEDCSSHKVAKNNQTCFFNNPAFSKLFNTFTCSNP